MKANPSLVGQKFGRYEVISRAEDRKKMTTYLCRCQCGNESLVYAKHLLSGASKGCHPCSVKRGWDHVQWGGFGEIPGGWWALKVARSRTGRKKQPLVTVSMEYGWDLFLKQDRKCALTGLTLVISNDPKKNTASIDRVDSSRGYEPGNIQWVHKHINIMKNVFKQDYFIELCRAVAVQHPIK